MLIVDELRLERVALAGSSLGGGLCLLLALMAPTRIERILLFNPAVYPQYLPWLYRIARVPVLGEVLMLTTPAEALVEGVARLGYTVPEKMPDELRRCYTRNLAHLRNRWQLMDVIRQLPGHPRDGLEQTARFKHVRQPVLLIWGQQERLLEITTPQRLRQDLPNVRVVTYEDLAHLPQDEAPQRLGPVVAEWLATAL